MKVRILSLAAEEIAEAALWFNSRRAGLGDEFWTAADELLAQIESNPLRFAKSEFATAEMDFRFALIRRFNYVIHFLVETNEVQIVAIAHSGRQPGYWLRRSKI